MRELVIYAHLPPCATARYLIAGRHHRQKCNLSHYPPYMHIYFIINIAITVKTGKIPKPFNKSLNATRALLHFYHSHLLFPCRQRQEVLSFM